VDSFGLETLGYATVFVSFTSPRLLGLNASSSNSYPNSTIPPKSS
jgi:hypothetical protein